MRKLLTIFAVLIMLQGCGGSAESSDREECAPAFERLLGITPPPSIKEIRHNYFVLYDAVAHWMHFTNDVTTIQSIMEKDSLLQVAPMGSSKHSEIVNYFKKKNPNTPSWFIKPERNTSTIYFKEDYMNHTFSELFLWVDKESNIAVLHVHYFD